MRRKKTRRLTPSVVIVLIVFLTLVFAVPYIYIQKQRLTTMKPVAQQETDTKQIPPASGAKPHTTPPSKHTPFAGQLSGSLFVPYWIIPGPYTLPQGIPANLDTLIYFGVTPQADGSIDTTEQGFTRIQSFADQAAHSQAKKLLTIRMLNEDTSTAILESLSAQQTLFAAAKETGTLYNFEGIVLDLEYSVLPTQDIADNIFSFVKSWSEHAKEHGYSFSIALYGDTYFRLRPYRVKEIGDLVDRIYIMAYDFHKSYGEPGPNFPLNQTHSSAGPFAYSFDMGLRDFSSDVHPEKLSIVAGLFGYDWAVDDQMRPLTPAKPLTLNQIQARFPENTCPFESCTRKQDPSSNETVISYTDSTGQKHVIWFDDSASVLKKIERMRTYGISHISIWAHGYFP